MFLPPFQGWLCCVLFLQGAVRVVAGDFGVVIDREYVLAIDETNGMGSLSGFGADGDGVAVEVEDGIAGLAVDGGGDVGPLVGGELGFMEMDRVAGAPAGLAPVWRPAVPVGRRWLRRMAMGRCLVTR